MLIHKYIVFPCCIWYLSMVCVLTLADTRAFVWRHLDWDVSRRVCYLSSLNLNLIRFTVGYWFLQVHIFQFCPPSNWSQRGGLRRYVAMLSLEMVVRYIIIPAATTTVFFYTQSQNAGGLSLAWNELSLCERVSLYNTVDIFILAHGVQIYVNGLVAQDGAGFCDARVRRLTSGSIELFWLMKCSAM